MAGIFIAVYVLFGIMVIFGGIFLYTVYVYSKSTKFTKTEYSWVTFGMYALVFVILVIIGSLFATTLKTQLENENWVLHTSLCFSFAFLTLLNAGIYVLIIQLHNKTKISYNEIDKTDFVPALTKIKKDIGDIEKFKKSLQKWHKNYFNNVNAAYQELLKRAKDESIERSKKLADIVLFNDTYSHKWSIKANNYQLLLTYEFLSII